MFQVRNFFFNVHIKSRSSEYISDIFVRFGVIGNSQKIWVVRNSKCSTNSYLDGSFDVVHHLDRASLLCWWCWSSSSRESFSREFSTCRINLRFLPLSALSYSPLFSLVFDIRIGLDPLLACCLILLLQKMFVLCEADGRGGPFKNATIILHLCRSKLYYLV